MSTGAADTLGFFSTMMGLVHSSVKSVPVMGASQSSSSSYEHTAPGYYSSYSCTSGGSVSFPLLGGIFSSVPHGSPSSPSDQSSCNTVYKSYVEYSPCSNTCWNSSNNNTPHTSNTSSISTHQPYIGCLCADSENIVVNTLVPSLNLIHSTILVPICSITCNYNS